LTERAQISGWHTKLLEAFEPGVAPRTGCDTASSGAPAAPALDAAASWLGQGVPVVIPTETVYGLAARARDSRAVDAVFQIKGRPRDNPLIVHVTRTAHLDEVGAILSPIARALTRRFWPGPLTLVVAGGTELPWVTAGLDSVAVRHPAHAFAAALIDRTGPLAAPSANRSGRPSPTCARHAARDLAGRVPLVVDGGQLEHGLESTVLDVRGVLPVLLRPGALPLELLEAACGRPIQSATAQGPVRAPGMKYRHYSPRAELWLYPAGGTSPAPARLARDAQGLGREGRRFAVLARDAVAAERFIAMPADPVEVDELGVDAILVEGIPATGVGRAVMDRLSRAATRVRATNEAEATPGAGGVELGRGGQP
jgi:L-threonylcarbamoyladenylate synthase